MRISKGFCLVLSLALLGTATLLSTEKLIGEYTLVSFSFNRRRLLGIREFILGSDHESFIDIDDLRIVDEPKSLPDSHETHIESEFAKDIEGSVLKPSPRLYTTYTKTTNYGFGIGFHTKSKQQNNNVENKDDNNSDNDRTNSDVQKSRITIKKIHQVTTMPLEKQITAQDLDEASFPKILLVYRVAHSNGATVRTYPSPIGAIQVTKGKKAVMHKIVRVHKQGDIIVGYKIMNKYGNWLKVGDNQWVPITKMVTKGGPFIPLLRLVKKLILPKAFNTYWEMDTLNCSIIRRKANIEKCNLANGIRFEVLRIMLSNNFVTRDHFILNRNNEDNEEEVILANEDESNADADDLTTLIENGVEERIKLDDAALLINKSDYSQVKQIETTDLNMQSEFDSFQEQETGLGKQNQSVSSNSLTLLAGMESLDENGSLDGPSEGDNDADIDDDESSGQEIGKRITMKHIGKIQTKPLANRFKAAYLEQVGFPKVLSVFKVVNSNGATVRTYPSPIGAIKAQGKGAVLHKIVRVHKQGDIVIGYKLMNRYGNWLKVGENQWIPITKLFVKEGHFVPLLKLVKKLELPNAFNTYWGMQAPLECSSILREDDKQKCNLINGVRAEVLRIMINNRFVTSDQFIVDSEDEETIVSGNTVTMTREGTSGYNYNDSSNVVMADDDNYNIYDSVKRKNRTIIAIADPISSGTKPDFEQENAAMNNPSNIENITLSDSATYGLSVNTSTERENDEDENKECRKCKSWSCCFKKPLCAWKGGFGEVQACTYEGEYFPPTDLTLGEYDPEYDYKIDDDKKKYFVYQPSGGWNNQRIQLENALIICRLTKRVCILPPAAHHTNYYENYKSQPGNRLISMQRILNIPFINSTLVEVATIPQGMSLDDFIIENKRVYPPSKHWQIIDRQGYKFKKKWSEDDIKQIFGKPRQKFLYFSKQSMWSTLEWKSTRFGYIDKKLTNRAVMYNNAIKKTALDLAGKIGDNGAYYAVHVRRGDQQSTANFKEMSHSSSWYSDRIGKLPNITNYVYIATDEKDRDWFKSFEVKGLQILFWQDLHQDILTPFLNRYPRRMQRDILGMIEQLICTYSIKFLGSGYSTFTTYILRMRMLRDILAADTSAPEKDMALPHYARTTKSTCNPLTSRTHDTPC